MASLKAIRRRVSSVKSTQQITKAMKMVAAAKLRRAQEAAIASRPYAERLEHMVGQLLTRLDDNAALHPLLQPATDRAPRLILYVASDRGLCGGYNANLWRTLTAEVTQTTRRPRLFTIGRKGHDSAQSAGLDEIDTRPMPASLNAPAVARELAHRMEQLFISGEVGTIDIVYSSFRSTLSQVPTVERLLPFSRPAASDLTSQVETDYLFEPNPATIVGYLLPRLLEVHILHALLEAAASELAARMTAMDSATRNASEMIDRLTLQMNRARQAAITTELMEIISGAEALNG